MYVNTSKIHRPSLKLNYFAVFKPFYNAELYLSLSEIDSF